MADPALSDQKYYDFLGVSPSASIPELKAAWARKFSGDDYSVLGVEHGASAAEIKKATQRATMITHPDRLPQRLTADPEFVAYSGHQFNEVKQRAEWLVSSKPPHSDQNEFTNGGQASNSNTDGFDYETSGQSSGGGASARDSFKQHNGSTNADEWDVLPSNEQEAIKGIARCEWAMGAENGFLSTDVPFVATVSLDPRKTKYLQSALSILGVHHSFDHQRSVIIVDGWDALTLRGCLRQQGKDCNPPDDSHGRGIFTESVQASRVVTTLFEDWMSQLVSHSLPAQRCMLAVYQKNEELAFFCKNGEYASKGMVALGLNPKFDAQSGITYVTGKEASLIFDELAGRGCFVALEPGLEPQIARAYEIVAKKPLPTPSQTQKAASSGGPSFG